VRFGFLAMDLAKLPPGYHSEPTVALSNLDKQPLVEQLEASKAFRPLTSIQPKPLKPRSRSAVSLMPDQRAKRPPPTQCPLNQNGKYLLMRIIQEMVYEVGNMIFGEIFVPSF
jgi:hypothetical protein